MATNIEWTNPELELEIPMSVHQQEVVCVYIPKALVYEAKLNTKKEAEEFMVQRLKYLGLVQESKAELTMTGASVAMDYFEHYLDCKHCTGERMDVCEQWRERQV